MRKMPIGAEIYGDATHFRLWAPKCKQVDILLEGKEHVSLQPEEDGYFSCHIQGNLENVCYQFIVDHKGLFPDPASRFQPHGPHGPSQVIDPNKFHWTDEKWGGVTCKEKVILYEFHVGTFTEEGTWRAAITKLPYLRDLGISVLEMMPIAEYPGTFNWGYDGVDLFAPTRNYGFPDDLRAFINEAHRLGLAVILDVVYNHFGPSGNYLHMYSDDYESEEEGEWGKIINFDGKNSQQVREFFIENAGYWIEEYHFDGLRLDACHEIKDTSSPHILLEISKKVRKTGKKDTFLVAENEQQDIRLILPENQGGYELDAVWIEDFHHSAYVRLCGRKEAYFSDYSGKAQEFVSSVKFNFLYQGQWYPWQNHNRGTPALHIPPFHFVNFLENHDQVANTGNAQRLHSLSQPKLYRAITAFWLLSPQIPLLFQGQEFTSSSHFFYFCDHEFELSKSIIKGRREFLSQFKSMAHYNFDTQIPLPNEANTFALSKLDWEELETHHTSLQLHKDLIKLRREDVVLSQLQNLKIEASVLTDHVFILRYMTKYDERLLIINLDIDYRIEPASDPLLAPPSNKTWSVQWTSELPEYGGLGFRSLDEKIWTITGGCTYLLYPEQHEKKS